MEFVLYTSYTILSLFLARSNFFVQVLFSTLSLAICRKHQHVHQTLKQYYNSIWCVWCCAPNRGLPVNAEIGRKQEMCYTRKHIFRRYFNFWTMYSVFSARWKFILASRDIGKNIVPIVCVCTVATQCWLIHFMQWTIYTHMQTHIGIDRKWIPLCTAENPFCIANRTREMWNSICHSPKQPLSPRKPQNAIVRTLFNALSLTLLYFKLYFKRQHYVNRVDNFVCLFDYPTKSFQACHYIRCHT